MGLIIWIIVGGLSGWIASMLMKTDASMGLFSNIIVGMIGSLIGGSLYALLFSGSAGISNGFTGFNLGSFILSILGAVILIWLIKLFRKTA